MRQGKITPEEAVDHPQRSVITRALGPEPAVEIDTRSYAARAGDVYLLCSDGLTTMLPEQRVSEILRSHPRLRDAGEALVAAANEAGGRDNITVVLLRLQDASAPGADGSGAAAGSDPETEEQSALAAAPVEPPSAASATPAPGTGGSPIGAAASTGPAGPESSAIFATTPAPPPAPVRPLRPRMPTRSGESGGSGDKRRRRRRVAGAAIVLVVLGLLVSGAYLTLESVYFIGTNSSGLLTLYRGVPYQLPGGVRLYSTEYVSGVGASTLSPTRRRALLDNSLRSESNAASLMRSIELGGAPMNRPIVRLYGLVVVLFALLIAFTSRWTIFEASSLRQSALNRRSLLQQERIERGRILAAGGTVLARSVRGREGTFQRTYPTGSLFAQAIGYSYTDLGQAGLERYRNPALDGETSATNLQAILDQLQGKRRQGDEVLTTLDPAAQHTALVALGEHRGAVVALDPRTGAVRVMASTPSYDPNLLRSSSAYERLTHDSFRTPLVNRATQFGYAPGSTFKVVTATAAIDTGQYTPQSLVSGRNGIVVSGVPLSNDDDESYGQITLTEGLVKSVNTVYAQVAEHVGKQTLARYMDRFGFDCKTAAGLPRRTDVRQRRV